MKSIQRIETNSWGAKIGGAKIGIAAALGLLAIIPVASAAPGPDITPVQAAADTASLPAAGTVTRRFTRLQNDRDRLTLMSGVLTGPSLASPETISTAFLATKPAVLDGVDPATLRFSSMVSLHRGHALRYDQLYRSLPVVGGGSTVVRLDDGGRVRWVSSSARPIPADLDITPSLTPRQALTQAAQLVGYGQQFIDAADLDNTVRLAVFSQPVMDQPRLAYWVELPQDMQRLAVWRGFVDAHTGHVYRMENKVVHGVLPTCAAGTKRAYVYPENPIETPQLECISLSGDIAPNQNFLINADISTGNCVDNNGCRTVLGLFDVHWCDDGAVASTNASNDFTDHQYTNDTDAEDTFAEVQMFHHLTKAFDSARALGGFTNLNARPLGAVVNFRPPVDAAGDVIGGLTQQLCLGPVYTGGAALFAFDNAAFIPAGGFLGYPDSDGLVFGQGNSVDFAFDGDVVYHEFGHALMNTVAPDLAFGLFDQYGFDPTPGGMHEGYADLMTLWVTDDPEVGEYAGSGFGLNEIRNMNNTNTCPANLVGETHEDALPITGAIWEAREVIAAAGGSKTTFDEAVFTAQQTFDGNENYQTAAAKTVAEVELAMGATEANTLAGVLAERGISDCNNRVADGTARKRLLFAGSLQMQAMGIMPAPVQFEYALPGGADSITIDVERAVQLAGGLTGGAPTLSVGVKQGSPVTWADTGNGPTGDYTGSAVFTLNLDPATNAGPGSVTLPGPFAAGTYYLHIFVEGGTVALVNTDISHPGAANPDAGPGGPDAGANADAGGNPGDGDGGGCGCVVGERDSSPLGGILLSLLGMVALVLVRRRR